MPNRSMDPPDKRAYRSNHGACRSCYRFCQKCFPCAQPSSCGGRPRFTSYRCSRRLLTGCGTLSSKIFVEPIDCALHRVDLVLAFYEPMALVRVVVNVDDATLF